jgi:hypothetical protein
VPSALYEPQRKYAKRQSQLAADIGKLPTVADPERRLVCAFDLLRFLTTYFPASTGLKPFSADHERMIARLQQCILDGGLFVAACYRGFGKTTIGENSALWAVLYGHRRFVPIFGAGSAEADQNIDSIKLELSENDLLYADFPEVCHAVRALEGKPQRCNSQTHQGQQTHIEWTADTVVLPTVRLPPGWGTPKCDRRASATELSAASGAIIAAHGIMAATRGMKHKTPAGEQQRPDFVFLDDPQTDESAISPIQTAKRLNVLKKSILQLGGHTRRMAAFMAATVIERGDVPDQLLDAKRNPAWQGERVKLVRKWSKSHETLWLNDYRRLRETYDPNYLGDQQRAHREATEFYRLNRERMDDGCEVSWEHLYDQDTEISAVQHSYNALIDDGEEVFQSEFQCEPIEEKVSDESLSLRADDVACKCGGVGRGLIPIDASRVVAFIDPKKEILYWVVCAFADGFSGWVVDYGTYPDQHRSYFHSRSPRVPLSRVTAADSWEAALYAGLDALVSQLASREWKRADGAVLKVERCLIDHGWGEATDTVDLFCRQSTHAAVLLPSKGIFIGATSRPFNEMSAKPGERRGPGWRIPVIAARGMARQVIFDANHWKSFVVHRMKTPMGGRGCLSLFGREPDAHRLFADHFVSEKPVAVEAKGRRVIEFKQTPNLDNDLFDCLVGCHVAAAERGVSLHERRQAPPRKVVSYQERLKTRRVWRANNGRR